MSISPIRAVVFDLDGLMVNTEELYREVGVEICRRRGRECTDELLDAMMGRPSRDAFRVMIEWHSLTDTVEALREESSTFFRTIWETRLELMPGVRELLEAIEQAGLPKAVATSSGRKYAQEVLGRFELLPRFKFVLSGDDVTLGKPHPEVYLTAAERLSVDPREMLVLEDSHVGSRAAHAAGAVTIAVPADHSRHHDFTFAHLVADTLADPRIYERLGVGRA